MTMNLRILSMAAAAFCLQSPVSSVFRSGTDAVAVDVAVFDDNRVVRNLGVNDFEVHDNGVRQTLIAADANTLPIDLRLVFDTSGSISERDLERYVQTMDRVAAALEPRDRCEIITFNSRIADAASRQHPPIKIALKRGGEDGTAFFDAVALAMVTIPAPDRRQITIVLSDAMDNTSFFDEKTMLDAARRTDAVVYTILPGDPANSRAVSVGRLEALSLLTGGRLVLRHETAVAKAVIDSLEEFRQGYVLRYVMTGVQVPGWHKLTVKVKGGYRVRARQGYFPRRAPVR
jgi:VWFA-related protein